MLHLVVVLLLHLLSHELLIVNLLLSCDVEELSYLRSRYLVCRLLLRLLLLLTIVSSIEEKLCFLQSCLVFLFFNLCLVWNFWSRCSYLDVNSFVRVVSCNSWSDFSLLVGLGLLLLLLSFLI